MKEYKKIPTREAYGEAILELGRENKAIYVVDCDVGKSCKTVPFSQELPNQYVNVGIAEQNACGVAAGLATTGKIPFVTTYAIFGSMRMGEQIRQEVCYPKLNVKIACSHGGLTPANDGASHQSIEDMGILRTIPNMTVCMPADYYAAKALIRCAAETYGPCYLRFTRDGIPCIYDETATFTLGKANKLMEGKDVAIIGNGDVMNIAYFAAEQLVAEGYSVKFFDMHTIKPLDVDAVKEAIARIGDAEMVYTNKTPITKAVMDACPNMKFISLLATGYNVVDVAYAKEKGIPVTNVPVYGTASVSQFAIALLLEVCHHAGYHSQTVYDGKWENCIDWCYWDFPLIELDGKTMGIVGLGKIGVHTAAIAGALGMKVQGYDPYPSDAGRAVAEYVDFETLLATSDVIAIHMPLLPFSEGLICKENIAKMKDGVIIINNSRGQIVVEQDLADALNAGKVGAAGLDVVATEPIRGDNPLLKAKNCIITPHISWAPKESRQRIMNTAVDNAKAYIAGAPINVVNP